MARKAETAAIFALCAVSSACDGCQHDKPYNPFGVTSALPDASAEPPPTTSAKPEPSKYRPAIVAPAGSRKIKMGELVLDAPPRYLFDRAVVIGEGATQQAVAWVKAEPEARDVPLGALIGFAASGERKQIAELPSFVPSAPGCAHTTRLVQSGPRSVLVDTLATCQIPLLARVPIQAISVISPASAQPEILALRLAAPAANEALAVDADSSDRDGDGREDVKLTLTLSGPDSAKASASLTFLDRAAGVSRDAAEPRASLLLAAKAILAKAGPSAIAEVDAMRRLLASLCAEGATSRVFDAEGSPLRCGDVGAVIDTLARAEVLARLAAKDPLGAVSVLTRSDWYFKKLSADAEKAITKELTKRLLAMAPTATPLNARPKASKGPHFSPLWFEPDGSLLIVGDAGVTRVTPDAASETAVDSEAGSTAWPLDVVDPGGKRLSGSLCSCDASEIQLATVDAAGSIQPGLSTRLLAPRPGGCRGRFICPDPVPIAASADGFSVLIAGTPVEPKKLGPALPSPGSARSPDGKWLVIATPLGLVVSGQAQELWKLPDAPLDTRRAQDCVVANDRAAVACVVDGRAVLFRRPQ
ncbi:MAG TPA: hypothetical protein VJN18_26335 [Polyangiaceae bacterium]|nr:hypothetical protein [Polyangiaceae bacterium]